jgi:hypothetical protein
MPLVNARELEYPSRKPLSFPVIASPYASIIDHDIAYLNEYLNSESAFKLLADLYFKLGKEVGEVFALIQNAGISWGTFEDLLVCPCCI